MKKILICLFLAIILLNIASAWSNNTFNNSLSTEQVFFSIPSFIRYFPVPEDTIVSYASINLTGILATYYLDDSPSGYTSGNIGGPTGSGNYTTFFKGMNMSFTNKIVDKVAMKVKCYSASCDGNISYEIRNYTSKEVIAFCEGIDANISSYTWVECDFTDVLLNGSYIVGVSNSNLSSGLVSVLGEGTTVDQNANGDNDLIWGTPHELENSSYNPDPYWDVFNDVNNVGRYFLLNITFNDGNTYSYPSNTFLEVGDIDGVYEWNYTNAFDTSEITPNFASSIQDYIESCTYVAGYCNVPFYFYSNTSGWLEYSSIAVNDTLPPIEVGLSCSAGMDLAQNYTLKTEENLTIINGTFDYYIEYGDIYNRSRYSIYGEIENAPSFVVCVNATFFDGYYIGYGEIQYSADSYVDRRYYIYDGTQLTNVTQNITLYDLLTNSQTSFKLEVLDTSLNPYVDKLTALIRWYPDLNEYNVVDMGKTDDTGSTVIHVVTEDVDYRIGVYEKNGTLIYLAEPIRMVCLLSPCTYTLKISPTDTDFTSFLNIDYSFTYNYTTGIWMFTFSDASQTTTEMNLTIYKLTGTSVYPICSDSITAYTGAITCNTSAWDGRLRGVVLRSASPEVPITEKIVNVVTSPFTSSFGLWISLLLAVPVIFIFAFISPLAAIIGGIIALIPALYFGAVNWTIVGGLAILGGIVFHFLKRIS